MHVASAAVTNRKRADWPRTAVLYGSRVGRVVVYADTEPGFCAGLMLAEAVPRMGLPEGNL